MFALCYKVCHNPHKTSFSDFVVRSLSKVSRKESLSYKVIFTTFGDDSNTLLNFVTLIETYVLTYQNVSQRPQSAQSAQSAQNNKVKNVAIATIDTIRTKY